MKLILATFIAVNLTVLLATPGVSAEVCVENARCPNPDPGYSILLPHYECTKYFACRNGLACEQNCPEGLHFNAYHGKCEDPLLACCDIYLPCNPTQ